MVRGLRETSGAEISVLRFLVPAEVNFALKSTAAQVARKRFVPSVLPAVRN